MPHVDILQQVRTQFERNPLPPSRGRRTKVLARSGTEFISDLPDKWRVDYDRRNQHLHTGFFAYNHVPYRSFGNLKYTDPYDLIRDSLGVSVAKYPGKAYHMNHLIQGYVEHNDPHDQHHTIKVVRDASQRRPLPHSRNAGLSAFWVALGAQERSVRDVEMGSSFRESLAREEERMNFLQEIRSLKAAKKTSSQAAHPSTLPHNTSIRLPPMVQTASSKACLTMSDYFHHKPPPTRNKTMKLDRESEEGGEESSKAEKLKLSETTMAQSGEYNQVGPNLYVALAAAHFKLHHGHERGGERGRGQQAGSQQQRRQCVAKLKVVHAILCCLHNMRIRDLRSREPLSGATLKTISRKPLHPLKDHFLHHDPHHHHHHHHARLGAHTPTIGHSLHHRHSAMQALPQEFSGHMTMPHHHMTMPHHHYYHHGKHPVHSHAHHQNKQGYSLPKHVKIHTEPHPETWEDLVALGREGGREEEGGGAAIGNHGPLAFGASAQTWTVHGNDHTHHPHHGTHHKPQRPLPPWQRQVVYVDEEGDTTDPAKQLHDSIEAFQYTKNELARDLKDALSERKQKLQKHLVTKLQELSLSANVEESLELMRERAYRMRREERAEEDNKPLWFKKLEKEANSLPRNEEGGNLLEKLKLFLCVDNDAIPHVMEKLCMIVMSLPANHLCLHPVISAVKFVLEHILKVPPKLCEQWLELRRLPMVTTELPVNTPPIYVLDMAL